MLFWTIWVYNSQLCSDFGSSQTSRNAIVSSQPVCRPRARQVLVKKQKGIWMGRGELEREKVNAKQPELNTGSLICLILFKLP